MILIMLEWKKKQWKTAQIFIFLKLQKFCYFLKCVIIHLDFPNLMKHIKTPTGCPFINQVSGCFHVEQTPNMKNNFNL